jgi:hypothetical protein
MPEISCVSEAIQDEWEFALAPIVTPFNPEYLETAGTILTDAITALHREQRSTERDAQEIRLYRGAGLVSLCQALVSVRLPDGDEKRQIASSHLGDTQTSLTRAIELATPYLAGDAAIQPHSHAKPEVVRDMIRREYGMTLAVKGARAVSEKYSRPRQDARRMPASNRSGVRRVAAGRASCRPFDGRASRVPCRMVQIRLE